MLETSLTALTLIATACGLIAVLLSVGKWIREREAKDDELAKRITTIEERIQELGVGANPQHCDGLYGCRVSGLPSIPTANGREKGNNTKQ